MVGTQVDQAQEQAQEWWVHFTPGMAASWGGHEWEGHFEHGVEDGAWDAGAVPEEVWVGFEFGDEHKTDYPVKPAISEMALLIEDEFGLYETESRHLNSFIPGTDFILISSD
jgi:hypothetical protein